MTRPKTAAVKAGSGIGCQTSTTCRPWAPGEVGQGASEDVAGGRWKS